jgi:CrcB protein
VVTPGLAAALAVGAGGTGGALARFAVDDRLGGDRGTVAVNVLGSLALGALVAAGPGRTVALTAGTGFCGAFTTFSSHAVTVDRLAADGRRRAALAYAGGTLAAALVGAVLGALLAGGAD